MNTIFKALNDGTRRKILQLLKVKDLTAGEIAGQFNISKPSISHHLDLLRKAGLVVSVKEGQYVYYSLNTTVMDEVLKWIISLQAKKNKISVMKKFSWLDFSALVVWLLPLVYLFFIYPLLPASVPVHYGFNGTADRYGTKNEFVVLHCLIMAVSAFVYLLLKFLPAIDPKKQVKYGQDNFQKLALGLIVFLAALNIAFVFATVHHGFKIGKLILPIIGLLFAFFGNMMHSIKPNYFVGVKTPWTLESEDNWRATHRLAGKIWFVGGIITAIMMLFLPPKVSVIVLISCILLMAFVPITYSYVYFKKHQPNQNS